MQKQFRRFELLLPTKFNSGLPVPENAFAYMLTELEDRFGAVSSESLTIAGQWRHEGQLYRDENVRVFVDCPRYGRKSAVLRRLQGSPEKPLSAARYLDDDLSFGRDLRGSHKAAVSAQ